MARQRSTNRPLSREHRQLWADAFLTAFKIALRRDGETLQRSLPAIVRVAEEAADAALSAYRAAVRRGLS